MGGRAGCIAGAVSGSFCTITSSRVGIGGEMVTRHQLARALAAALFAVWSLVVLPDNRTLVSGGKDGSVLVWDMAASPRASSPSSSLT